ncbi:MAG: TaqI-like C-terminal specificity domain-containing protein [Alphaproteobacteria bacterium]
MGELFGAAQQLCPDQRLSGRRQLRRALLALDFRWPSQSLVARFRETYAELTIALSAGAAELWPKILVLHFDKWLRERLLNIGEGDHNALKSALREMSGLGAMLMHLKAVTSGRNEVRLVNERRRRTAYCTYPTSPRVAEALARYVWNGLVPWMGQMSRPLQIFDPTIEGGPLLLELAFLMPNCATPKDGCRDQTGFDFVLSGVDQNPVSAAIVSTLLKTWRSRLALNHMGLAIRNRDAFDALSDSEPLDAIVNNPPWGARTDGADGAKLVNLGPYIGYRDPYIALVSSGISRLKPGRPFGYVLPFQLLAAASAGKLREELLENAQLDHVVLLPRKAFPYATVKTIMLLGCRRRDGERRRGMQVVRYPLARHLSDPSLPTVVEYDTKAAESLNGAPWLSIAQSDPQFAPAAEVLCLGDVAQVVLGMEPYRLGRGRPKQTHRELSLRPFTFDRLRRGTTPVARSRDIARFRVRSISEYIRVGPWLAASGRHLEFAGKPRAFVRQICSRDGSLIAAVAPSGIVARYGVFTVVGDTIAPDILCALLNSEAMSHFVRLHCAGFHKESFGRIAVGDLRNLPIPKTLLRRGRGAAGSKHRIKLRKAVSRAILAGAREDIVALSRIMITINVLINAAFGWACQLRT